MSGILGSPKPLAWEGKEFHDFHDFHKIPDPSGPGILFNSLLEFLQIYTKFVKIPSIVAN